MPTAPCLLLLALSPGAPALPQDASPRGAGAGARPRVLLESLSGEERVLDLAQLASLDPRELVFVRFEGFEPPPPDAQLGAARAEVVLARGDRLRGRVEGRGEDLVVHLLGGVEVVVPIDDLQAVLFERRLGRPGDVALAPAEEGDRLYWLRGESVDVIDGTVDGFGPEGVRLVESPLGDKLFPWNEVAALFVETFESSGEGGERSGERVPVVCDLIDSSRLAGRLIRLDGDGVAIEVASGSEVRLPLGAVAELFVDDGRASFLSEHEPRAEAEGSPFDDELGMRWPHRMDRSVTGPPLVAGGRTWTRGIGVHAPSRLVFALDGSWSELRGLAAVDDQVLGLGARGSVVFRVSVDGEERWASPVLRGGQPPHELPAIDLRGARELVLQVDMASDYHVADRADWLRMLLVRGG